MSDDYRLKPVPVTKPTGGGGFSPRLSPDPTVEHFSDWERKKEWSAQEAALLLVGVEPDARMLRTGPQDPNNEALCKRVLRILVDENSDRLPRKANIDGQQFKPLDVIRWTYAYPIAALSLPPFWPTVDHLVAPGAFTKKQGERLKAGDYVGRDEWPIDATGARVRNRLDELDDSIGQIADGLRSSTSTAAAPPPSRALVAEQPDQRRENRVSPPGCEHSRAYKSIQSTAVMGK